MCECQCPLCSRVSLTRPFSPSLPSFQFNLALLDRASSSGGLHCRRPPLTPSFARPTVGSSVRRTAVGCQLAPRAATLLGTRQLSCTVNPTPSRSFWPLVCRCLSCRWCQHPPPPPPLQSLSYPGTAINQRVQSSSSVVYTELPVVITTISECSCWRWWWCVCCIYARALYDSVRLCTTGEWPLSVDSTGSSSCSRTRRTPNCEHPMMVVGSCSL